MKRLRITDPIRHAMAGTAIFLACIHFSAQGQSSATSATRSATRLTNQAVVLKTTEFLKRTHTETNLSAIETSAQALFEQVAQKASFEQAEAFRAAYRAVRLLRLLKSAEADRVTELTQLLEQSPELADELAFTITSGDKPGEVVNVLLALLDQFGIEALSRFPGLTAAVALVHDEPQATRINENTVQSAGALEIFAYYSKNAHRMMLPMDSTPAALLTFVVDAMASTNELQWALNKHQGNNNTGALFHTIEYDYNHYRTRTPKAVTLQGYSLPNIERFGGICADQAYFAVTVGKAIGVPAVYTVASSGEVAHAWAGYFKLNGRQSMWDFNEGRWPDYQGLAGRVVNPQTGKLTTDNLMTLRAATLFNHPDKRYQAKALAFASHLLGYKNTSQNNGQAIDAQEEQRNTKRRLNLIQAALKLDTTCMEAWSQIARMAEQDLLTDQDRKNWAGQLSRMTGKRYPGYTFEMIVPMIQSVDNLDEQDGYWNRLYELMQGQPDLQAYARLYQGQMWEEAGNFNKAGWSYYEIITNFPNAGRFVVDALQRSEKMLIQSGRSNDVINMYEQAWQTMDRPFSQAIEFASQSNYFRTGQLLAQRYEQAGLNRKANTVRQSIGMP